jgi:hypothetical protein
MIKFIKDIHKTWSLRGRIALAIGFIVGVMICGFFVHDALAKNGCNATMNFFQYSAIGATALFIFGIIISFGSYIVFGVFSAPRVLKEWMENWRANAEWRRREKEKQIECYGRYYSLKVLAGTFGIIAALILAITILGAAIGYLGWLFLC